MRVAEIDGLIEAELVRQGRHRLGRRGRPQHGLGRIAGQNVHDGEHDQGRGDERRRENRQPLQEVEEHRGKLEASGEAETSPRQRSASQELFAASAEASRSEISDESARAMRISASRAARRSA